MVKSHKVSDVKYTFQHWPVFYRDHHFQVYAYLSISDNQTEEDNFRLVKLAPFCLLNADLPFIVLPSDYVRAVGTEQDCLRRSGCGPDKLLKKTYHEIVPVHCRWSSRTRIRHLSDQRVLTWTGTVLPFSGRLSFTLHQMRYGVYYTCSIYPVPYRS